MNSTSAADKDADGEESFQILKFVRTCPSVAENAMQSASKSTSLFDIFLDEEMYDQITSWSK